MRRIILAAFAAGLALPLAGCYVSSYRKSVTTTFNEKGEVTGSVEVEEMAQDREDNIRLNLKRLKP
jgi:hypothetical protein